MQRKLLVSAFIVSLLIGPVAAITSIASVKRGNVIPPTCGKQEAVEAAATEAGLSPVLRGLDASQVWSTHFWGSEDGDRPWAVITVRTDGYTCVRAQGWGWEAETTGKDA